MGLLPQGSNILGSLTQGTSLQQLMQIVTLLNNLHQLQGEVTAIPTDILNALNQTASLLGTSMSNLTNILLHETNSGKSVVLTELY